MWPELCGAYSVHRRQGGVGVRGVTVAPPRAPTFRPDWIQSSGDLLFATGTTLRLCLLLLLEPSLQWCHGLDIDPMQPVEPSLQFIINLCATSLRAVS